VEGATDEGHAEVPVADEAPAAAPPGIRPLAAPPAAAVASPVAGDEPIGRSGERLTRHEAFDLVQRAVAALVQGDEGTTGSATRRKAFELLGRDSESLQARLFERILQDAHDANLIDLRRRGDEWEVARAADAASIVEQLKTAEAAQKAAMPAAAPVPRGMGARGIGARGKGGPAAPPPELLMVGVVGAAASPALPAASVAPTASATGPTPSAPAGEKAAGRAAGAPVEKKAAAKGAVKPAKAKPAAAPKSPTKAKEAPAKAAAPAKKAPAKPAATKAPAKPPAKKAPVKAPAKKAPAKKAPARKSAKAK
jgi:hypothetical protein